MDIRQGIAIPIQQRKRTACFHQRSEIFLKQQNLLGFTHMGYQPGVNCRCKLEQRMIRGCFGIGLVRSIKDQTNTAVEIAIDQDGQKGFQRRPAVMDDLSESWQ